MGIEVWKPRWGLTARRPFRMPEDTEKFFEDLFVRPSAPSIWHRTPSFLEEWSPKIEMYEKGNSYIIKAELPGMEEKDIDVSISDDVVTLKGERSSKDEVDEDNYYCCERSYGNFYRSIMLPSNTNPDKAEANLDEGVLEISIPKVAESKAKKLSIHVNKSTDGNTKPRKTKKVTSVKKAKTI